MKTISIALLLCGLFQFNTSFAQKEKEIIPVWGSCGMCKAKIENAAKEAGADKAKWNPETKELSVSYDASKTTSLKIQEAIAKTGYDTRDVTADQTAYNSLHGCCKYERKAASTVSEKTACCSMEGCVKDIEACRQKGCCKGMTCCKQ